MLAINPLIQIILSKTEKRILVILLLLFLLIVLFIGLLSMLVDKLKEKNSKKIDPYVTGYVQYEFVKTPHEFKIIGKKKNELLFFKQSYIGVILLTLAFILITISCLTQNLSFNYIWKIYEDMLIKIEWNWNTIYFISLPSDWPHINTETSLIFHGSFSAISAYIFLVLFVSGMFILIRATIYYMSREKRIKEKANTIFNDSLDSLDSTKINKSNENS